MFIPLIMSMTLYDAIYAIYTIILKVLTSLFSCKINFHKIKDIRKIRLLKNVFYSL